MSDEEQHEGGEEERESGGPPASEKQIKFIQVLQKRVGVAEEEMQRLLDEVTGKAALEDLTVREASELIDELHTQARERGVDLDAQVKASDKQVGFIKSLKRRAHLTDDEFTTLLQEQAGVTVLEELGRRDASAVIDALLARADGKGGDKPAPRGRGAAGGAARRAPAQPAPRQAPPPPPIEDYDDDDVPF